MTFRTDLTGENVVEAYADYHRPQSWYWPSVDALALVHWLFRLAKNPPDDDE